MGNIYSKVNISIFLSCLSAIYSISAINIIGLVAGVVGVILTFIISFYLVGKYNLLEELKSFNKFSKTQQNLVIMMSVLSTFTLVKNSVAMLIVGYEKIFMGDLIIYKNWVISFSIVAIVLIIIVGIVNFFFIWTLLLKLYGPKIWLFFKSFNKFENRVLYLYVSSFAVINLIILVFTSAFTFPMHEGELIYNAIFSLDTAYLINGNYGVDVFSSPASLENDIRHLLFGIISLPLAMVCMPISYTLALVLVSLDFNFVIWNFTSITIYGYLISVGQAFLFALSGILIYKMLRNEIEEKLSKSFLILYLISYSTVLYTVAVEQYAITTFTLILFVYFVMKDFDSKNTFIIASLSITSSFAMLPLVFMGKKINLKLFLKTLFYIGTVLTIVMIYFGQLPEIFQAFSTLKSLSEFLDVDGLSFTDKFIQYIGFIPNIFIAPNVVFEDGWLLTANAGNFYNLLGLILLLFSMYSIIANRYKKIMFIATYWVFISFVILVIVGWGSVERTMVLYTSYFGWAFLILFALGFSKVFGNTSFGNPLLVVIISILSIYNAAEFINYVMNIGAFR